MDENENLYFVPVFKVPSLPIQFLHSFSVTVIKCKPQRASFPFAMSLKA